MKRVVLISDYAPGRGVGEDVILIETVKKLAEDEVDCTLVFREVAPTSFLQNLPKSASICVLGSPMITSLSNFLALTRMLFRLNPDLVVARFVPVCSVRMFILACLFPCVVVDVDGATPKPARGILKLLKKIRGYFVSRAYRKVACISQFVQQRDKALNFLDPEKTVCIYHGVPDYFAAAPQTYRDNFLLYVGRLEESKGIHILIEALEHLSRKNHAVPKLVVIGDGMEAAVIRARAESSKVKDRIEFIGFRNDVPRFLQRAQLCIVPSVRGEAFGLAAAEAIASKCPLLASDSGALPELVGPEGLLFRAGSASHLAEKLGYFLSLSPEERNRLGERGYERWKTHFRLDDCVEKHIALYKSFL